MTIAIVASGTLLQYTISASPTTIPEVKKISGPGAKFDLLDATSHDSGGYKEWIPGLHDAGDMVTADFNFKPTTVHIKLRTDIHSVALGTLDCRVSRHWQGQPRTGATAPRPHTFRCHEGWSHPDA